MHVESGCRSEKGRLGGSYIEGQNGKRIDWADPRRIGPEVGRIFIVLAREQNEEHAVRVRFDIDLDDERWFAVLGEPVETGLRGCLFRMNHYVDSITVEQLL
jgi:hypothetical protein